MHQQHYASGGTADYEQAFQVVLFAVFLINIIILVYWLWHRAWFMDFSDPTAIISIAIGSPVPEKTTKDSDGDDTSDKKRLKQPWIVTSDPASQSFMLSPKVEEGGKESHSSHGRARFSK